APMPDDPAPQTHDEWVAINNPDDGWYKWRVYDSAGNIVANIVGTHETEAMLARSIAATPDLLEAAQAVLHQLDYLQDLWCKEGITNRMANMLRTAVVKATTGAKS